MRRHLLDRSVTASIINEICSKIVADEPKTKLLVEGFKKSITTFGYSNKDCTPKYMAILITALVRIQAENCEQVFRLPIRNSEHRIVKSSSNDTYSLEDTAKIKCPPSLRNVM